MEVNCTLLRLIHIFSPCLALKRRFEELPVFLLLHISQYGLLTDLGQVLRKVLHGFVLVVINDIGTFSTLPTNGAQN